MSWIEAVQSLGVPVVLTLFFVWQGKIREDRMSNRLNKLEDYLLNRFEEVVSENTSCMLGVKRLLESNQIRSDSEMDRVEA